MRACAAILIFAASPCFIQTLNSRSNYETSPKFSDASENVIYQISMCLKNLGLAKCIGAYGDWRAGSALGDVQREKGYGEKFSWKNYKNISSEEIYLKLCNETEKLLRRRSLQMSLTEEFGLQLGINENGSLIVDIIKYDPDISGRSSMKKLMKHFYHLMPFLLIPGLIMSAILPFFLPSLKFMTIATGMLNNMALTGAVFTLLRNNAFNDNYKKKIIYVNDGYFNDKYEPLADTPSQVIVDNNFDSKFGDFETHDLKHYHFEENNPIDNDYRINSEWLQGLTTGKVKNVKIIPEKFSHNDWRKQDDLKKDDTGTEGSNLLNHK